VPAAPLSAGKNPQKRIVGVLWIPDSARLRLMHTETTSSDMKNKISKSALPVVVLTADAYITGIYVDSTGSPDGHQHDAPVINMTVFASASSDTGLIAKSSSGKSLPNNMITGEELGDFHAVYDIRRARDKTS
jgi:hypothetical protein